MGLTFSKVQLEMIPARASRTCFSSSDSEAIIKDFLFFDQEWSVL